jgi:predicted MPP superfamily phosphohydrolase
MTQALVFYNSLVGLVTVVFVVFLYRIKNKRLIGRTILLGVFQVTILVLGAMLYPVDGFGRLQLLAWGVFLHFPLYLIAAGVMLFDKSRLFFYALLVLVLVILGVATDAFLIEPRRLEVSHTTIYSTKLEGSIKVAVLADIQTDNPGPYETRVLAITAAENPDLVLLAGDYLQIFDQDTYQDAVLELRNIFKDAGLKPPLGIYAVQGNVEHNDWAVIFQELSVKTFNTTETLDLGLITLTGVSWLDSVNPNLVIPGSEKYHIVLGHSPNFSLGEIDADLLLAGHTHGGQFQLPGIGPLLTLSLVPRSWAAGLTEIEPDQYLLVSRGIGLERGSAPRMRFLCRPELVILEIKPTQ